MEFKYNDGGRAKAGFKGEADDCAVRAMAIVTGKPYMEIYNMVNDLAKSGKGFKQRSTKEVSDARTGVWQKDVRTIMLSLGWIWTPTMQIGQGCKVHLKKDELPMGRVLCNVSRHFTAVIDGVVNDTHDCSRDESRCVYGYYTLKANPEIMEVTKEASPNNKEPKVRAKKNMDAEKIAKLISMKKAWSIKLKRAENKLKKLSKKINYYQNKKTK
jgi:hypothetical protein